jgi:hypothetical protein
VVAVVLCIVALADRAARRGGTGGSAP